MLDSIRVVCPEGYKVLTHSTWQSFLRYLPLNWRHHMPKLSTLHQIITQNAADDNSWSVLTLLSGADNQARFELIFEGQIPVDVAGRFMFENSKTRNFAEYWHHNFGNVSVAAKLRMLPDD